MYTVNTLCIYSLLVEEGDIILLADEVNIISHSGRVEVLHNNQWGTVCDNLWDHNDAQVACRQLGYTGTQVARYSAYYGQGSGPIWLSNVTCNGSENYLINCSYDNYTANCNHYEDAGVTCSLG